MTAWFSVVLPMLLVAKCAVDFIALEYGSKFKFISDKELAIACTFTLLYAMMVDVINLKRKKQ